ncbi:glycosyltransferase family 4 protein [Enterococcus xiangfangensis]|uniref:glycosyltransferase family 4 protein n=1 Tax=Enterococcus xiangfangensis TaxID=1296537 RepID=UPI0010F52CFF|nr:glycosyltransferase family 4 protein [Enterococcus xiangfangensis]MBM7712761.1 glycosyltransferase involved in cell wall biosynthesis [Enterococcus xiangfangensis]
MKVLNLCSYYNDKFYEKMIDAQIRNKVETLVYYPRKKQTRFDRESEYVISTEIFDSLDKFFFNRKINKSYGKLTKMIEVNSYDCVHAHTVFSDGAVALKLKSEYNLPYVVSVRNTDVNFFFKYRFLQWRKGLEILKNARYIICLSSTYKDKILETCKKRNVNINDINIIEKKIRIITNGIDDFFLENQFTQVSALNQKISILTVGEISKRKNQLKVCEAIQKLNFECEYTIIGKIKDKSYFKKIIGYKFVKHVPFLEKKELLEYYRNSDVFILPSLTETFGLVYVEALSQNMPIIYSENEGFDRQFEDGLVGKSVKSLDSIDIKEKIEFILENKNSFDKNFINARKFSWDVITRKQVALYQTMR